MEFRDVIVSFRRRVFPKETAGHSLENQLRLGELKDVIVIASFAGQLGHTPSLFAKTLLKLEPSRHRTIAEPVSPRILVARAIRNAIRANRFARIIRNRNPYFYSVSGRFARITRISDSRESPDSRESCESIRRESRH